jgi:hypothetical protein
MVAARARAALASVPVDALKTILVVRSADRTYLNNTSRGKDF